MRISEARHRANEKWIAANLDSISVRVKKGQKAVIQQAAQSLGESTNKFITRLINAELVRLNFPVPEEEAPKDE